MTVSERPELDPVPGYRYAIQIDGVVHGWFTECTGLSVERSVESYSEGGVNAYVHQLPGRIRYARITLARGVADRSLWDWLVGTGEQGLYEARVEPRTVTVVLYGADRSVAQRWHVERAYPAKWTGPEFQSDNAGVALETLEIVGGGAGEVQRAAAHERRAARRGAVREIDLPALAAKVYELLQEEARVERQRLGRVTRRR